MFHNELTDSILQCKHNNLSIHLVFKPINYHFNINDYLSIYICIENKIVAHKSSLCNIVLHTPY